MQRQRIGAVQQSVIIEANIPAYQKFEEELLDMVADNVTYHDIFAPKSAPRATIQKLHYRVQPLYTACLALTNEAVNAY